MPQKIGLIGKVCVAMLGLGIGGINKLPQNDTTQIATHSTEHKEKFSLEDLLNTATERQKDPEFTKKYGNIFFNYDNVPNLRYTVAMFSAEWCKNCPEYHDQFERLYQKKYKNREDNTAFVVFEELQHPEDPVLNLYNALKIKGLPNWAIFTKDPEGQWKILATGLNNYSIKAFESAIDKEIYRESYDAELHNGKLLAYYPIFRKVDGKIILENPLPIVDTLINGDISKFNPHNTPGFIGVRWDLENYDHIRLAMQHDLRSEGIPFFDAANTTTQVNAWNTHRFHLPDMEVAHLVKRYLPHRASIMADKTLQWEIVGDRTEDDKDLTLFEIFNFNPIHPDIAFDMFGDTYPRTIIIEDRIRWYKLLEGMCNPHIPEKIRQYWDSYKEQGNKLFSGDAPKYSFNLDTVKDEFRIGIEKWLTSKNIDIDLKQYPSEELIETLLVHLGIKDDTKSHYKKSLLDTIKERRDFYNKINEIGCFIPAVTPEPYFWSLVNSFKTSIIVRGCENTDWVEALNNLAHRNHQEIKDKKLGIFFLEEQQARMGFVPASGVGIQSAIMCYIMAPDSPTGAAVFVHGKGHIDTLYYPEDLQDKIYLVNHISDE